MLKKCFLIPYYGQWPVWFPHFLHSCSINPEFDFLFFTDISSPMSVPDNVRFLPMSLKELEQLASEKAETPIVLTQAYKLCDLKPLYGKIFEDYISFYAYWGHLDIDVVLGKLNHFLSDDLISRYDVLSSRKEMINGSCSLYRNTGFINTIYKSIPFVMDLINDTSSHYLDEFYFTRTLLMFQRSGKINMFFSEWVYEDALNEVRGKRTWCLLFSGENMKEPLGNHEVVYFHFIHSKRNASFVESFKQPVSAPFMITDKGLLPYTPLNYFKQLLLCVVRNYLYYLKRIVKSLLKKANT